MHRSWPLAGLLALSLFTLAAARPLQGLAPWIDGVGAGEPQMQVQAIDPDTYVIRQSVHTNFEAPFLYLLFGRDRAVLFDTGAGGLRIRPTIDRLIADWSAAHGGRPVALVVAHSHGHGDHHQGDAEFRDRPDTTVVGLAPENVAAAFGIARWPEDLGHLDLGGRILTIIPTPGHERSAIMVYDPRTRVLLSGDALYPGRLYFPANHFLEYRAGIDRAAAFARTHRVSRLLGTHIEMTRAPGVDFGQEAPVHAGERRLELDPRDLQQLDAALHAMGEAPRREVHDDFIITPVAPQP